MRSSSGLSLVPVASGEPFDVGLLFTYFGPKFWDYAVRNRKGPSSRMLFVNLPSAFIRGSSWTCSWSTISGDNFAWQRYYSNCLYDRNWFLEHKIELQNELCFSAGLMKFLRFLKFVYLFFQSKICWWGEIPDWFHYGLWMNKRIFSSVHESTVSTYTGVRQSYSIRSEDKDLLLRLESSEWTLTSWRSVFQPLAALAQPLLLSHPHLQWGSFTLLPAGVCNSRWVQPPVAWPAKLTQTQCLPFTEGGNWGSEGIFK